MKSTKMMTCNLSGSAQVVFRTIRIPPVLVLVADCNTPVESIAAVENAPRGQASSIICVEREAVLCQMRAEVLLLLLASTAAATTLLRLSAPTSRPLPHVWTSTGFSPEGRVPGWAWPLALTPDEHTAMALIGSLRNATLTHVRIHWLLDFVAAK